MSTDPKSDDVARVVVETFAAINKQFAAIEAAETARRAGLTPEQRAAEDLSKAKAAENEQHAKVTQRLSAMGPSVLARETWTLNEFGWLLSVENPEVREGWGDLQLDSAADEHERHRRILESCVDASLHPVNSTAPAIEQRFRTGDLMRVAIEKRLGCHAALWPLMKAHGAIRSTAPAFASTPAAFTGAAPETAAAASVTGTGASCRGAPVTNMTKGAGATSSDAGRLPEISGTARRPWHSVLRELLDAIGKGAAALGEPFDRRCLPDTTKTLHRLVVTLCKQRGVLPPQTPGATAKQVGRFGFGFGGSGHKPVNGKLERFAKAGGLKFSAD